MQVIHQLPTGYTRDKAEQKISLALCQRGGQLLFQFAANLL